MKKGLDVSEWDYAIDWSKVETDFAIIRLGFGNNVASQNDKYFEANVKGCVENNIPFGVYIFSYANDWDKLYSEIEHAKSQLNKIDKKPFCVFIDMEDKSTVEVGKGTLTEYGLEFCKQITAAGYRAGVYANENWFKNHLDVAKIANAGYVIWCAKYSSNPPQIAAKYDIWQYTSSGKVNGIYGKVDLDYMYTDLLTNDTANTDYKVKYETLKKKVRQILDEN